MVGNFAYVDIKPDEALSALHNMLTSLNNMAILNEDIINEFSLLNNAIMDDGLDYIFNELNRTKNLIEQSIQEAEYIANIILDYIYYIKHAYEKTNY